MSQDPTDEELRAHLAKSDAMRADFAKLWRDTLSGSFIVNAAIPFSMRDLFACEFAAKQVAWAAYRAGRDAKKNLCSKSLSR